MSHSQRPDVMLRTSEVPPAALARLIAEVAGPELKASAGRYNRTHNRHNR